MEIGFLTAHAHITKSVMCEFFRKNVMRCVSCCFQNVVLYCLNSTNPIDKVNFIIMKTKRLFNFFEEKYI